MRDFPKHRLFKTTTKVSVLVLLIVGGNLLSGWIADQLDFELRPSNESTVHRVIMLSIIAYTVLMALPFVPGVEIGLALIVLLGPKIVLLVYLCTVVALSLSFVAGRFIPERVLAKTLRDLHLNKAGQLVARLEALDADQRVGFLLSNAPTKIIPFLIRYRYLAIVIVLNLPGNVVIGGGGGIALIAGMSKLFSFPEFFLTLAVAVSPIPLAVFFFGP